MARKYIQRDNELVRRCYIAWMAYTKSKQEFELNQDGFSDFDAKENHDVEILKLTEQRDAALAMLKQMVIDFRVELHDLKMMFQAKMTIAMSKQDTDLKLLVDLACNGQGQGGTNVNQHKMISIGTQVGTSGGNGSALSENGNGQEDKKIEPPIVLNKKKKKKIKKYKGRTLTLNKVLDIVAGMWEKKIKADMVDDAAGKDRDTLGEFAVDFFVQMYGSVMKKKKIEEFKHSIQQHRSSNIRIKW